PPHRLCLQRRDLLPVERCDIADRETRPHGVEREADRGARERVGGNVERRGAAALARILEGDPSAPGVEVDRGDLQLAAQVRRAARRPRGWWRGRATAAWAGGLPAARRAGWRPWDRRRWRSPPRSAR